MTIKIYQVKHNLIREFGFMGFEDVEHFNGKGCVRMDNYDRVYEFDMESSCDLTLDDIYEIFNMHRPEDFHGHSLSVSDVSETDDGFYYCDSFGWKTLDWGKDEPEE